MPMMISTAYTTLNGMNVDDAGVGGRLADKMAGGTSGRTHYVVDGYTNEGGNEEKRDAGKLMDRGTAAPDRRPFFKHGREESGQWRRIVRAGSVLR